LCIPGIIEAAVVLQQIKGDNYLCAYFVTETDLDKEEIKNILRNKLPEYMIPTYMIPLETLPTNSNGKLDKRALPIPEFISGKNYVKAETKEECSVAQVFEEILGIDSVGQLDNFFELGGDSIKAIRVVSKLREHGYEISVKDIMQGKTVKVISSMLRNSTILSDQGEVCGYVRYTPIQKLFFDCNLSKPHHFNQSIVLESKYAIEEKDMKVALNAVVEHHDILRAIYKEDKQLILPVKESSMFELLVYNMAELTGEKLKNVMNDLAYETQSSLSLEEGPLLKAVLFQTLETNYLLLTAHHLVIDGVSWRILVEDLNTAYMSSKYDRSIALPPKTISYKQWSELLFEYRKDPILQDEYEYWKNVESFIPENRIESTGIEGQSGYYTTNVDLSMKETNSLLYEVTTAYDTEINDLLIAALARALQSITNSNTLVVNLEGHGRERISDSMEPIDRTIGWFTSVYPVAVKNIGNKIEDVIRNVKCTLRDIKNHGIGYGILSYQDSSLGNVQPDITFNYLGEIDNEKNYTSHLNYSNCNLGCDISEKNRFGTPISVNCIVSDGVLHISASCDLAFYSAAMMDKMSMQIKECLNEIVSHCIEVNSSRLVAATSEYNQVESPLPPLQVYGINFHLDY
ncbi:MAG TPA: condensation domain-containing protein, partial [Lachnospiraceae bacterium]|nr:condensation domain-containing protein [Lachnospiraceae bacterium]